MAGGGDDGGGIVSGINVTPLVDVTLVLLIIFIVTARIVVTPALPADLPRGSTTQTVATALSVVVPLAGPTTCDGVTIRDDAELVRIARAAIAKDPEVRAVITADGGLPHRQTMHVLDLLRAGGVEHVAFAALPTGGAEP